MMGFVLESITLDASEKNWLKELAEKVKGYFYKGSLCLNEVGGFLVEGSDTKHLIIRELDANTRVNAKVEICTFLFMRKPFQSREDYEMRNDCCITVYIIFIKLSLRDSLFYFIFFFQTTMKPLWE